MGSVTGTWRGSARGRYKGVVQMVVLVTTHRCVATFRTCVVRIRSAQQSTRRHAWSEPHHPPPCVE